MCKTMALASAVACFLVLSYDICNARLITVAFTADVVKVQDGYDVLEGKVEIGDTIRGTYAYDTSAPDTTPWDTMGQYEFRSPSCGISLHVDGYVFRTDPNNPYLRVDVWNDSPNILGTTDRLYFQSYNGLMSGHDSTLTSISDVWIYIDLTALFGNGGFPLLGLQTDRLPAFAPIMGDWPACSGPADLSGPKRHVWIKGSVVGVDPRKTGISTELSIEGCLTSAVLATEKVRFVYVDDDADELNDGSSWFNAYRYLQDALHDVNDFSDRPVQICVAEGRYRPDQGRRQVHGDKAAAFQFMDQVTVRGGYAGLKGTNPDARNCQTYKTTLTGDLKGDDRHTFGNRSDNSIHVVCALDVDESAVLDGFFISSGNAERGGGVFIENAYPMIVNCTFKDNLAYQEGGAVYIDMGAPTMRGCTFTNNRAERAGGAMYSNGGVSLKGCLLQGNVAPIGAGLFRDHEQGSLSGHSWLVNCTLVGNRSVSGGVVDCGNPGSPCSSLYGFNSIFWDAKQKDGGGVVGVGFNFYYSDLFHLNGSAHGNINVDPCFVAPGYWANPNEPGHEADLDDPAAVWIEGDYHLKSQAGHWDLDKEIWVKDDVTSPCIDAGDPANPIGLEPFPNGGRINMGAFGGTVEASKSYFDATPCETVVAGDINGDCKVDFKDFQIMASHWLEQY